MSWTGSENQRRPQGVCLPPSTPANTTRRYTLPIGTRCLVSKVSPLAWQALETRIELAFDKHEGWREYHYTFRHAGYLIRVHCSRVVKAF